MMILLLLEQRDLRVPRRQQGQGGRLNTAHIQGAVIENGEKPRGVDPHQPVSPLAAEGRLIEAVIFHAGAQLGKALPDGAVLHGRDPKPEDRLAAAGHFIHQTEDQFTFTPGVAGVDDLRYVLPRHEALHIVQSRLLAGDGGVAEGLRQDGQILIAPFFEALVIAARVQRGYQVPHAPGNDQAAALIKAIGPG